ncbi:hypothetical protein AGOR_G00074390 [Albula goreensis]|uniref:Fibronectin type-III domain-containing protein n=1 Tax=Albula goreensis TaxID=1534307 RepID=A0A8T3DN27_9TELE|nr:hypothetical protein AGOR_G00074390 [Albula goreensis]
MWCSVLWKLMAFSILLSKCQADNRVTVDRPRNLQIIDPGHLGQLYIHWNLPASLENQTECPVRFQLQFFDTYEDDWTTIRTTQQSYLAQFDLEQNIHVRVQTMLGGPCTNGSGEVLSLPAEVLQKPLAVGSSGSKIKDLSCVFYQREYMDCIWEKGHEEPPKVTYHLYFWHKGMEMAMECPIYLQSHGYRSGCRFLWDSLIEFTEFNVCVNGSSSEASLQPAYFSMQIQNHVKPGAIDTLRLETHGDGFILLEWTPPKGRIPNDCLEFEVESRPESMEGLMVRNITTEPSFNISTPGQYNGLCFRIRSRVHILCSDDSFWSEWSHPSCMPESPDYFHIWTQPVVLCVLAIAVIIFFSFSVCCLLYRKVLKTKQRKSGALFG